MKDIQKILTFGSLGLLFLLLAVVISMVKPKREPKVTVGRVEFQVEIANDPSEWRRGLVGHATLSRGQGMLFIFPSPSHKTFWMKDMTFPIDIIWIKDNRVIGFVDNAEPDQGQTLHRSPGLIDQVLEIAAGEREKLGIIVGAPVAVE